MSLLTPRERGLLQRSLLQGTGSRGFGPRAGLIQSQFAGRSQDGRKLGGDKLKVFGRRGARELGAQASTWDLHAGQDRDGILMLGKTKLRIFMLGKTEMRILMRGKTELRTLMLWQEQDGDLDAWLRL